METLFFKVKGQQINPWKVKWKTTCLNHEISLQSLAHSSLTQKATTDQNLNQVWSETKIKIDELLKILLCVQNLKKTSNFIITKEIPSIEHNPSMEVIHRLKRNLLKIKQNSNLSPCFQNSNLNFQSVQVIPCVEC